MVVARPRGTSLPQPVEVPAEQRFVLDDVPWHSYAAIANELGERHLRLTFDRGRLEFMTLSRMHERYGELLGLFIRLLANELHLPLSGGGAMTFQREDLERGIEPDKCFWIATAARVPESRALDLSNDPPPDLAVEVDVTSSSLNRVQIYAGLGVPEVWRFDGQSLTVQVLEASGYAEAASSRSFPGLAATDVRSLVVQSDQLDDTALLRAMLDWIRKWRSETPATPRA